MKSFLTSHLHVFFFVLLGIDIVLVGLSVLHTAPWFETSLPFFQNHMFSLAQDRGISEIWQYSKEITLVVLCLALAHQHTAVYIAWAGLFLYFFLDDAFRIHEVVGKSLADMLHFESMFHLRAQDFGELLVYLVAGGLFFGTLFLWYRNVKTKKHHHTMKVLNLLLAAFVVFGVFFDMLSMVLYQITHIGILVAFLELIEEGGEMLVLTLFMSTTALLLHKKRAAKASTPVGQPAYSRYTTLLPRH